jgi:hypothetical protein
VARASLDLLKAIEWNHNVTFDRLLLGAPSGGAAEDGHRSSGDPPAATFHPHANISRSVRRLEQCYRPAEVAFSAHSRRNASVAAASRGRA